MRKFMSTLICLVLSAAPAALAQSTTPRTVTASATTADLLDRELTRFSGMHLAFADCQARMAEIETMLGASGYGPRATHTWPDGSVYAGWYDSAHHITVMAVAGPSDDGQGFQLDAYTIEGQFRWTNDLSVP